MITYIILELIASNEIVFNKITIQMVNTSADDIAVLLSIFGVKLLKLNQKYVQNLD